MGGKWRHGIMTALLIVGFAAATASIPSDAFAFGASSSEDRKIDAFRDGVRAVNAKDFARATQLFQAVVQKDPKNADAFNYLAYSQRNLGQLDAAMQNYNTALTIKPDHKGALEYQGELFLMMGNQTSAEGNLDKLTQACPHGCKEKDILVAAIARFKETKSSSNDPLPRLGY